MAGIMLAASAKSSGFSPLSLNPDLWLDATDSASLKQTVGGVGATADNDPVGEWLDLSGNSRNVSQGTAGNRPILKTAIQNGKNIVRFDGTNDFLSRSWPTELNAGYVVLVVAAKRMAVDTEYRPLLRLEANNTFGIQYESTSDPVSPGKFEGLATQNNNTLIRATPSVGPDTSFHAYAQTYDGSNMSFYRDGSVWGGPSSISGGLKSSVSQTLRIGSDSTGAFFGDYDIGEILIIPTTSIASTISVLNTYAQTKWGTP